MAAEKKNKSPEDMLTTQQVADYLGCARETVRQYCYSGILECIRLPSGHFRIRRRVIERYLQTFDANAKNGESGGKETAQ